MEGICGYKPPSAEFIKKLEFQKIVQAKQL